MREVCVFKECDVPELFEVHEHCGCVFRKTDLIVLRIQEDGVLIFIFLFFRVCDIRSPVFRIVRLSGIRRDGVSVRLSSRCRLYIFTCSRGGHPDFVLFRLCFEIVPRYVPGVDLSVFFCGHFDNSVYFIRDLISPDYRFYCCVLGVF